MTSQTENLDPFALGGRHDSDDAILAAFWEWIEATRATAVAGAGPQGLLQAEFEASLARDSEQAQAIAEMPAAGAVGLAVKVYLALHSRNGGNNGDAAALFRGQWVEGYDVDFVELALAEDLVRFIPELAPLLTSALATGRKALYEPDDSEGDAQAVEGTSKTLY